MLKTNAALIAALLLLFTATSCGPKHKMPDAKPLPEGTSFTGVWYSPQFEHMYLRQTGDEVHGIYTYKTGGTLEGKVSGNLLKFTWVEPGDKDEARRSFEGRGYLQLVKQDGKLSLAGEWGYKDNRQGAGVWEAEWVRKLEHDDPRSLKEWREQRE